MSEALPVWSDEELDPEKNFDPTRPATRGQRVTPAALRRAEQALRRLGTPLMPWQAMVLDMVENRLKAEDSALVTSAKRRRAILRKEYREALGELRRLEKQRAKDDAAEQAST